MWDIQHVIENVCDSWPSASPPFIREHILFSHKNKSLFTSYGPVNAEGHEWMTKVFIRRVELYRRFYGWLISIEPWTNQLSITIISSIYPSLHCLFMEYHCLWLVDQYWTLDQPTLYNNNNLHISFITLVVYGRSLFMDGYSIKKLQCNF